jgi:hypothetical protein
VTIVASGSGMDVVIEEIRLDCIWCGRKVASISKLAASLSRGKLTTTHKQKKEACDGLSIKRKNPSLIDTKLLDTVLSILFSTICEYIIYSVDSA